MLEQDDRGSGSSEDEAGLRGRQVKQQVSYDLKAGPSLEDRSELAGMNLSESTISGCNSQEMLGMAENGEGPFQREWLSELEGCYCNSHGWTFGAMGKHGGMEYGPILNGADLTDARFELGNQPIVSIRLNGSRVVRTDFRDSGIREMTLFGAYVDAVDFTWFSAISYSAGETFAKGGAGLIFACGDHRCFGKGNNYPSNGHIAHTLETLYTVEKNDDEDWRTPPRMKGAIFGPNLVFSEDQLHAFYEIWGLGEIVPQEESEIKLLLEDGEVSLRRVLERIVGEHQLEEKRDKVSVLQVLLEFGVGEANRAAASLSYKS